MIDFNVLQEARKKFSSKDIPLLKGLIDRMYLEKPYKGLRIVYNSHMTLSSVVQIEALVASGADVVVTIGDGLSCDPAAVQILKNANIAITPYATLDEQCDVALDCCGKLLLRAHPTYGVIELTQTGVVRYENAPLNFPVISIDGTQLKKVETSLGTGDGFVRGFRKAACVGLHHKKFVLFGYGKVGKGIVRALSDLTHHIVVVEHDEERMREAQTAGLLAYRVTEKEKVLSHLRDAFCVVTATGVEGLMSAHFEHDDIQAKHLVNMGSEDEWGAKFSSDEILNKKLAVNFCLEQPTRILFLDAIFYAQNMAIDILLNKKLTPQVHILPQENDLDILSRWISNHHRISLEGDYLQNIIGHIPCYIYWKDRDSVYQGCNGQFAKAAGLNGPEEIIGKTDYELAWGETEAEVYRQGDQEAFKGKARLNFEETQKQANGKQTTVLASKAPFHDDDGNIVGVLGIYTDISERKQMEESLRIAVQNSEAANKSKTEFIANMSHDVKTPLSGIISISEALCSRVQEEYRDLTQDVLQAGQHLMVFFENCIELSKLESGSIVLSKETFSLRHLINEILNLFRPAMKAKGLALHMDCDEKIPKRLLGSRVTLYRILLNLLGNAVKFTPQGSITVRTQLSKNSTPEKAIIKLTIADTGIGIPADKQKLIFERFARLTPSYQGTYEGSGIGLYIVEEFVKSMHGEIHVKSEEGKGSQFTVVVPLRVPLLADNEYDDLLDPPLPLPHGNVVQPKVSADKSPLLPVNKEGLSLLDTAASRINVLLVEDSLMAQKGASLLLSSLGCKVDVASCGGEAIALFKPGHYALVLMDIGLPDMKGYEVARRLKKLEEGTSFSVPILGLSAHATEDEKQLSATVGMAEMLSKPLLLEKARAVLMQYVAAVQATINENLLITENGLRIIDLQKAPDHSSGEEQTAWEILDELIGCLPEFRAEIEEAYVLQDRPLLMAKLHKFRGGLCYTKAPHLLQAVSILEAKLRDGEHDGLEVLYTDVLKAIETLEKVYQSL